MMTIDAGYTDMELALQLSYQETLHEEEIFFFEVGGMGEDMEALAVALSLEASRDQFLKDFEERGIAEASNTSNKHSEQSSSAGSDHSRWLAPAKESDESQKAMSASICERAWSFVQAVLDEHTKMLTSDEPNNCSSAAKAIQLEPIGIDDMMDPVERLMETQASFNLAGKNTHIDIGYHYTRSSNLQHITANGLLSSAERRERGVLTNYNGSSWGDGIYTSSSPFAFSKYGDTGILVARLRGNTANATRGDKPLAYDTAVANWRAKNEMVILSQSCQCIPLLQFKRPDAIDTNIKSLDRAIWVAQGRLQQVVDAHLNGSISAVPYFERPPPRTPKRGQDPPAPHGLQPMSGAAQLSPQRRMTHDAPPETHIPQQHPKRKEAAPREPLLSRKKAAMLLSSGAPPHPHGLTFQQWKHRISNGVVDPVKKTPTFPSSRSETFRRCNPIHNRCSEQKAESMRVLHFSKDVLSCDGSDTLVVVYSFFKSHREPQQKPALTHRISFYPDSSESKQLLERLKDAFYNGIIDVITWPQLPQRNTPYLSCKNNVAESHKVLDELAPLDRSEKAPATS